MTVAVPHNIMERRAAISLRAEGRRLEGIAAPFDSPTTIGDFSEVIKPGAFRRSLLAGRDILALADHDPSRVLGRTRSGTLRLAETSAGLAFSLDLPETQTGRDLLALAERGDLGGMSFGFNVTDEAWPSATMRELREVELVEISVVQAFPAYSATSVIARSRSAASASMRLRRRFLETL